MGAAMAVSLLGVAHAQQMPRGFAVERLYLSAPGGGWMVMDDLDLRGGVGGAIAVSSGYAHDSLRVKGIDGSQRLAVVRDQAFVDFGVAATYDRYRVYLNVPNPLAASGESGTVGPYSLSAPSVDLGKTPDTISDVRVGFDARLFGVAGGPLRLGGGAQLFIPSGDRSDYVTDGTYRGMGRVLVAGDLGPFLYAGQIGVHVRPLDDAPAPGSPRGSELLFGVAAGTRISLGDAGPALIVGPEIYGETALRSFLGEAATGLEGLLTGRIEAADAEGPRLRVKLATGAGIDARFGAPEWRLAVAIEVLDRQGAVPPASRAAWDEPEKVR
jgi:hypothetical protein